MTIENRAIKNGWRCKCGSQRLAERYKHYLKCLDCGHENSKMVMSRAHRREKRLTNKDE